MIFFKEIYVISILISSLLFWGIIKEKYRTKFIILASFAALAVIQLKFTLFLVLLVVFVLMGSKVIQSKSSIRWLTASIIILTIVLLSFKYLGALFALLFSGESKFSQTYMIPLGISYLSFKLIAFVVDVYRGNIENPNLEDLLAFMLFLPIFPAGPIERYQNFAGNRRSEFDPSFYIRGLKRLSIGYFKKILIVNLILNETVLKILYPRIAADGVSLDLSAGLVLLFLIGSLLYAYVDLSAYADIAIGYGNLFGYEICENMNYPLLQKNLSDYWNCWHISLSHWCRNNVYFPVLGRFRNNVLALYSSFIVMGLWHYLSLNWILWGIWHASGITLFSKWNRYKRKHKKIKKMLPAKAAFALGVALTVIYSGMGFSFIMMDTTPKALRVLLAIII
jgi:alginate O-acetyltransferase complex protein AlgI